MINKVIEKRKSTREFSDKKLNTEDLKVLSAMLENLPKLCPEEGLIYNFFENGEDFSEKLEGVAGYNGIMIKAPQYVVLSTKSGNNNLKAAGYAAEWLALGITEREIGSCWISTNSEEEKITKILGIKEPYTAACIIALGYPEKPSFLSSIFGGFSQKRTGQQSVESDSSEKLSSRLSTGDFIYMDNFGKEADLDEIEQRGYLEVFHYMRFAPSSLNRQPWRFVIGKDYILLVINSDDGYDDNRLAFIEAGIAMLYFKVAMSAEGFNGIWSLDDNVDMLGTPKNYIFAGTYSSNV